MDYIEQIRKKFPMPDRWAMYEALFEQETGGKVYTRSITLIHSALLDNGYKVQATKMDECKPSRRCLSPYCNTCQRKLFEKQRKRFDEHLLRPYKNDEEKSRKNLFFITVLHALIPFDQPDDTIVRFPTAKIKSAIAEARKQFKSVRRSFKGQISFVGAFELEALTGMLVQIHPVKGQVLAEMNGTKIGMDDKFILVHSHFVVDMNELSIDQLKTKLKQLWPSNKQVDVSPLYEDKPVNESLRCLADYGLKFPIKYYYRFTDIAEENELIINGKKHNWTRNFEPDVLAQMITGISEIGINALYIRSKISKASSNN